eukprot:TRINITY_DN1020_c0_g1_i1.p1 TRINITY_DN1020_c0_g1~~TRINITY_DN1020_c0_g1_i1.p1  ORF type:complete len:431 (+),score=127.40 TRINITY_DN1020_c0_g1_i1:128-1420(+)
MRLTSALNRNLSKLLDTSTGSILEHYAKFSPSPLSIHHFLEHGRKPSSRSHETAYFFMRKEIPVRLANIIKELELTPEVLQKQVSFCRIQDQYVQSFKECIKFQTSSNSSSVQESFKDTLKRIRARHIDTVPMMAEALLRMKEKENLHSTVESQIQYFLNRLYMSRISIHMMIHQHALTFECPPVDSDLVGCIHPECNILGIISDAYEGASLLCEQTYCTTVEKNLTILNTTSVGDPNKVIFPYVPSHLYYILFELIKNALRATIETHVDKPELPKVDILVVKSPSDVTIKISDQGGGIPYSDTERLFQYTYSTAPEPSSLSDSTPMAGLGYGLPLSRLYARYFRGDVVLSSLDGYGSDVTVYLRGLSEEACEYLPVYNHMTKLHYEKPRPLSSDWTDPTASLGTSQSAKLKFHKSNQYKNGNISNYSNF